MSTDFTVFKKSGQEVSICERSARFDLDLYDMSIDGDYIEGPQQMSAQEALDMSIGIIYAVWCSYPDEAEAVVQQLCKDIPLAWSEHPTCLAALEQERVNEAKGREKLRYWQEKLSKGT
jgi:hypothetical protein